MQCNNGSHHYLRAHTHTDSAGLVVFVPDSAYVRGPVLVFGFILCILSLPRISICIVRIFKISFLHSKDAYEFIFYIGWCLKFKGLWWAIPFWSWSGWSLKALMWLLSPPKTHPPTTPWENSRENTETNACVHCIQFSRLDPWLANCGALVQFGCYQCGMNGLWCSSIIWLLHVSSQTCMNKCEGSIYIRLNQN
jgi:hypothetical protein